MTPNHFAQPSIRKLLLVSIFGLVLFYVVILLPIPILSIFALLPNLLLGWAIPSLINILITLFVLTFIKTNKIIKVVLFVVISFVLGVNSNFYNWFRFTTAPDPVPTSSIGKPLEAKLHEKGKFYIFKYQLINKIGDMREKIFSAPVTVGSNEACFCLYYVYVGSRPGTLDPFSYHFGHHYYQSLSKRIDFREIDEDKNEYSDIKITLLPSRKGTAELSVEISDNGRVVSWFKETGIVYASTDPKRYTGYQIKESDISLFQGYFLENTADFLAHDNFWSWILDPLNPTKRFQDTTALDNFLRKAILEYD